jgi:hypothetical protein
VLSHPRPLRSTHHHHRRRTTQHALPTSSPRSLRPAPSNVMAAKGAIHAALDSHPIAVFQKSLSVGCRTWENSHSLRVAVDGRKARPRLVRTVVSPQARAKQLAESVRPAPTKGSPVPATRPALAAGSAKRSRKRHQKLASTNRDSTSARREPASRRI